MDLAELSVDALALSLITADRQATDDELAQIVAHVAAAPFSTRLVRVTRWLREQLVEKGIALETDRLPSVNVHLLKRVYIDGQWPTDATVGSYLSDLHQAVSHPDVRIWTYRYYAEPYVGFLSPSHVQTVLSPQPYIFVAYNPRYGAITTGYQAGEPESIFTDEFKQLRKQR